MRFVYTKNKREERRESHARRVLPARDDAEYTPASSTHDLSLQSRTVSYGVERPRPSRITGRCHRGEEKKTTMPEIADRDWFRLKPRSHSTDYSRAFNGHPGEKSGENPRLRA